MPSSTLSNPTTAREQAVWQSLKQAIAESSGFQRWQQMQSHLDNAPATTSEAPETELDEQVRRYLRETLATLAY